MISTSTYYIYYPAIVFRLLVKVSFLALMFELADQIDPNDASYIHDVKIYVNLSILLPTSIYTTMANFAPSYLHKHRDEKPKNSNGVHMLVPINLIRSFSRR